MAFDNLAKQKNVVLTTFKRDGSGVPTAVHVAVGGEHAYVRTWATSGKAKRLRHDQHVTIAPSTASGKSTGPSVDASARLLDGAEALAAGRLLAGKYPVLQGRIVPIMHKIRKYQTVHYELTAD